MKKIDYSKATEAELLEHIKYLNRRAAAWLLLIFVEVVFIYSMLYLIIAR